MSAGRSFKHATHTWVAFAPGKVILLGEHAAVYGHPALAGPLSLGVTARGEESSRCQLAIPSTVKGPGRALLSRAFARAAKVCGNPGVRVTLTSELPVSMGLGSSAAVSVGLARLLLGARGEAPSVERVLAVALELEREFHGTPSGIDHTVSAREELLTFQKSSTDARPKIRRVKSPRPLKVLLALGGPRKSTRETVAALRARQARYGARYDRLFRQMGQLAREGAQAVEGGDLEALGDAMNVNHGLLAAAGLSSPSLDGLVHQLRAMGALGAKLTGAGGEGGAVVGLFYEPEPAVAKLTRLGVPCFSSQVAGPTVF